MVAGLINLHVDYFPRLPHSEGCPPGHFSLPTPLSLLTPPPPLRPSGANIGIPATAGVVLQGPWAPSAAAGTAHVCNHTNGLQPGTHKRAWRRNFWAGPYEGVFLPCMHVRVFPNRNHKHRIACKCKGAEIVAVTIDLNMCV